MNEKQRHKKTVPGLVLMVLALTFFPAIAVHSESKVPQMLHPVKGQPMAKDFELPDLDGKMVKLSSFRGKVVLVNFWATWCPPCRKEIPSMQRAWQILKDKDVMMLAIHVGGNMDKVWTFLTDFNADFPVLLDKRGATPRSWPMVGLPTSFVVDPEGRIVLRAIGGREWDDPGLIKSLLDLRK